MVYRCIYFTLLKEEFEGYFKIQLGEIIDFNLLDNFVRLVIKPEMLRVYSKKGGVKIVDSF